MFDYSIKERKNVIFISVQYCHANTKRHVCMLGNFTFEIKVQFNIPHLFLLRKRINKEKIIKMMRGKGFTLCIRTHFLN